MHILRIYGRSTDFMKINFTNIEGNMAQTYSIFCFETESIDTLIEYCNFLKNYQNSTDMGTIISYSTVILNKCCIFGNMGKGNFILTGSSESSVTNSFYDKLDSNIPIITSNNKILETINHIRPYYSYACVVFAPKQCKITNQNLSCIFSNKNAFLAFYAFTMFF